MNTSTQFFFFFYSIVTIAGVHCRQAGRRMKCFMLLLCPVLVLCAIHKQMVYYYTIYKMRITIETRAEEEEEKTPSAAGTFSMYHSASVHSRLLRLVMMLKIMGKVASLLLLAFCMLCIVVDGRMTAA